MELCNRFQAAELWLKGHLRSGRRPGPERSPLTCGRPGGLGLGAGSEGQLWLQQGPKGSPGRGVGVSLAHGQHPLSAPTPSPSPHHPVSTPASFLSYKAPTVCVHVCVSAHVCTSGMQGPHLPLRSGPNKIPPHQAFLYRGRPFSPPPLLILSPPGLSLLRPSWCPAHTLRLLATGRDPRLPDEWATEHPTTGMGGPAGQEAVGTGLGAEAL